mmetsp:Transcript_20971/g.32034  ORF Transcript_20971/g.32034 Transcript_20971/m.32034 type:complete len:89 (+) Transcript_20971:32-298(+)
MIYMKGLTEYYTLKNHCYCYWKDGYPFYLRFFFLFLVHSGKRSLTVALRWEKAEIPENAATFCNKRLDAAFWNSNKTTSFSRARLQHS